jgi:hypothetical protein
LRFEQSARIGTDNGHTAYRRLLQHRYTRRVEVWLESNDHNIRPGERSELLIIRRNVQQFDIGACRDFFFFDFYGRYLEIAIRQAFHRVNQICPIAMGIVSNGKNSDWTMSHFLFQSRNFVRVNAEWDKFATNLWKEAARHL